jgi:hypothetical protein
MRNSFLLSLLFVCIARVCGQRNIPTWCERNTALLFGGGNATSGADQLTMMSHLIETASYGFNESYRGITLDTQSVISDVFTGRVHYRKDPPNYPRRIFKSGEGQWEPHMVAYFGEALGCNGLGFPQRLDPTTTMRMIHADMRITQVTMDYHNLQITASMTHNGVSDRDVHIVHAFLNSFSACGYDPICNGLGCVPWDGSPKDLGYGSDPLDSECSQDTAILQREADANSNMPMMQAKANEETHNYMLATFIATILTLVISVLLLVFFIYGCVRQTCAGPYTHASTKPR